MSQFQTYLIDEAGSHIPRQYLREAGVLLPVSSLPSPYGIGTLGQAAFDFIDFLQASGQTYWQVLPVGPTSFGDSPYQSYSTFAGNPYLIDLDGLIQDGLLSKQEVSAVDWGDDPAHVDYDKLYQSRMGILKKAFRKSRHPACMAYQTFCTENKAWLDDYSLFMALKSHFHGVDWHDWEPDLRDRKPQALAQWKETLKEEIDFHKFTQYEFDRQWERVQSYAKEHGIAIIGDLPIYVALDSADVWVHQEQFQLDTDGKPTKVAGVPPDAFSADGQLWGNPLYRWDVMEKDGFAWWKERMAFAAKRYDWIRIDHFIGIVRYFSIPAGDKTAANGKWVTGPGKKLTKAIHTVVDARRIIAEDLGVVVQEVNELRDEMGYPGMKIMQFGFDGNPSNDHFPENYRSNMLVYGGTHDNETLLGYFTEREEEAARAKAYLGAQSLAEIPFAMLEVGYATVARLVIFQAQDLLELPNSARMNFPSTVGGNWQWRLKEGQLTKSLARRLKGLVRASGRMQTNAQ